jgi:hypothetical protein
VSQLVPSTWCLGLTGLRCFPVFFVSAHSWLCFLELTEWSLFPLLLFCKLLSLRCQHVLKAV